MAVLQGELLKGGLSPLFVCGLLFCVCACCACSSALVNCNAWICAGAVLLPQGELVDDEVLFVAAGEYFSAAASRTMVYGWGSNDYLCTGVGRGNPVQVCCVRVGFGV